MSDLTDLAALMALAKRNEMEIVRLHDQVEAWRSELSAAQETKLALIAERDALRAEVELMRPVVEAAVVWRGADPRQGRYTFNDGRAPFADKKRRVPW